MYLVAFAAAVIGSGWYGFQYFHTVSSVDGNIESLGDDISLNGEEHFRRQLESILDRNGIVAEGVQVSFDRDANAYDVVVPTRWTLVLPFKRLELTKTFRHRVMRHDELGRP